MSTTDVSQGQVESVLMDALADMGHDRAEVTRDAALGALEIDSLDMVELTYFIEEKWGVEIEPEDFLQVATVGDAVDLVVARLR